MKTKNTEHLEWIYNRMKSVHNENDNLDYMIKFREVIDKLNRSIILDPIILNLKPSKSHCCKHRK